MGTSLLEFVGTLLFCVFALFALIDAWGNNAECMAWILKAIFFAFVYTISAAFLLAADLIALVFYPFWGWKHPWEVVNTPSLSETLDWQWLIAIVNPNEELTEHIVAWLGQCILRPIDSAVPTLWRWWFIHHAPIKKRVEFIDKLGSGVQGLSEKEQIDYFKASSLERKVYLIKNNMLSPDVLTSLFPSNTRVFAWAGRVHDKDFKYLHSLETRIYAENYDLSVEKQKALATLALISSAENAILADYILRKGMHPQAAAYLCAEMKNCTKEGFADKLRRTLQARQDLVAVQKTLQNNQITTEFGSYLASRGRLCVEAQYEMSSAQYKLYHEQGLRLAPEAVHVKLARVNKNEDAQRFVALMMHYGELNGDDTAQSQVAGSEMLTAMWLRHLAEKPSES
jgi:hypothetical protein